MKPRPEFAAADFLSPRFERIWLGGGMSQLFRTLVDDLSCVVANTGHSRDTDDARMAIAT